MNKREYLVHLCSTATTECQDVWIETDADPEARALELYPHVNAVRLLFNEDDEPISREVQPCNCIDGRHYNNADETSGMWVPCDKCEERRNVDPGDDIDAADWAFNDR